MWCGVVGIVPSMAVWLQCCNTAPEPELRTELTGMADCQQPRGLHPDCNSHKPGGIDITVTTASLSQIFGHNP